MRYMIVNEDRTGKYYRRDFEGNTEWQPLPQRATLYDLGQAMEVVKFIKFLNAGESLKIVAVLPDLELDNGS